MQFVIDLLELLRRFGAKVGPYVLVELLLPGGTLFALLLFLHQRLKANAGTFATRLACQPRRIFVAHDSCLRVNNVERGSRPDFLAVD